MNLFPRTMGRSAASARGHERVEALLVEAPVVPTHHLGGDLAALHRVHPEQGLQLSAALGREAAELRESILIVGSLTAEERVEALLDRLMESVPAGEWLRLPLSRAELAEFVGLAPETVSRVIHRLARAGHFEVRGRRIRVPPAMP